MDIVDVAPAALPERRPISGSRVTLVPLDAAHAEPLFAAMSERPDLWFYMFDRPPADLDSFRQNLLNKSKQADQIYYTIMRNAGIGNATSQPVGIASYLRIERGHRVIEVGNIMYSPLLQRTPAATEAMYLMAKYIFEELGYRRYEWKCNALNQPSRRAALRLGFLFEGIFRQHMIIKGENRDTAWFAMLDHDWPTIKAAFEQWLAASNFDSGGKQKRTLESFRADAIATTQSSPHE